MGNAEIIYGEVKDLFSKVLKIKSYTQVAILVDENTKEHCLPLLPNFPYNLIEIKSGECHKNIDTCQQIWKGLLDNKMDRHALLINLGGGVITDMGGFCASTYKRGIDFINIPTTLLAMVDASIGGKTGIDFQYQKNMIGLFSEPKKVIIDSSFLNTLDKRQVLSGKAEMLKHGIIANKDHFEALLNKDIPSMQLIQDSIQIKAAVVKSDPFEKGPRKALNFGHTLGHALETLYLQEGKDILHGEAVAQGMIWAIKLSVEYSKLNSSLAHEITSGIESIYGNINLNNKAFEDILNLAKNDKKNQGGNIHFCLLEEPMQVKTSVEISIEEALKTLSN